MNRRALIIPTLITAAALALVGCSSSSESSTSSNGGAVATAASGELVKPSQPTRVDVETFAGIVQQPGVTVIDVRTPQEFAEGHLANAVNIDLQGPDFTGQIAQLDPAGIYAVYCRSANRSAEAVQIMAANGVTGTYEMDGGIIDWEAAGQPVVQ